MSFASFSFAVFYLLAMALRFGTKGPRGPYQLGLLLLSLSFYAWHVPRYIVLILFSTAVDYGAALWIARTPASSGRRRRAILLISLTVNLGLLGTFKYLGFLVGSFRYLAHLGGFPVSDAPLPDLVLPIGISFYTFQSMSYTIDVYRGRLAAERSFLRVATYIAFFPQLVAGPIVRASDFLYQLGRRRRFHPRVFGEGAFLIVRGLFLKMVVADNLGYIVDRHWAIAAGEDPPGTIALAMVVFFACQLFCDFAGYSSIARGVAYQLGFRLTLNFDAPYIATSFSEFWRRWHISLSTWMRDYLYIPLGGRRGGRLRNAFNLLAVMTISGLWHGANWTFVAWGALLGVAAALERLVGLRQSNRSRLSQLLGLLAVQATWVLSMGLFRSASIDEGWRIIHHAAVAFGRLPEAGLAVAASKGLVTFGWWLTVPVVALHARTLLQERFGLATPSPREKAVYAAAMLAATLTLYAQSQPFIYFQF